MAKNTTQDSSALRRAVTITALSALAGMAYYVYLKNVPFPPDLARIVPLAWLVGAIIGLRWGLRAFRADMTRPVGFVIIAVGLLSVLLAAVFSMAALMGD